MNTLLSRLHALSQFVDVAVLLLGALLAAAASSRGGWCERATFQDAYHALRADLGRAILLGLELLVIADIIGTVAIRNRPCRICWCSP